MGMEQAPQELGPENLNPKLIKYAFGHTEMTEEEKEKLEKEGKLDEQKKRMKQASERLRIEGQEKIKEKAIKSLEEQARKELN
jgi:hypothetical protein